jgi:penicillin-binding protein 2
MFERRLKIFLLVLLCLTGALLARAMHVQVLRHSYWTDRAAGLLQTTQTTETVRGRILDVTGKVEMAVEVASTDACVDYRAIIDPPDPEWLNKDIVTPRLYSKFGRRELLRFPTDKQKSLRQEETAAVLADIESMWATLAELYLPTDDDPVGSDGQVDKRAAIEEIRHEIVHRVEMRKRWVWYRTFQKSKTLVADEPQWQKWLAGTSNDGPDIDSFAVVVGEEREPHVILRGLDLDAQNLLGKHLEKFPGLVLRASTHRQYPLKEVACHVLGRMSRVNAADVAQAKADGWDERRAYQPNDEIGREGVEALCEPLLRGLRGEIERRVSDGAIVEQKPFESGQDVRLSIDADLQAQVQQMLKHVRLKKQVGREFQYVTDPPGWNMHAAAVVLDVKTNEVRVLASNPTFDVNDLDTRYAALVGDKLNNPLVDRATCDEFEPGSTVKPLVGLGAITDGIIGPLQGIECTGYLILDMNGKRVRMARGRCWVASEYAGDPQVPSVAHHPIPFPHRGHDGNPDGWLTYSDALERSCDVFFETVADKLGSAGMAKWYDAFGFGRLTGIGITERKGLRPGQRPIIDSQWQMTNCYAGMGQGQVWATPLQIANEAATIARGGIWMRPQLLTADTQAALCKVHPRSSDAIPDRVDLHLSPEGLRQAKIGMIAVVNAPSGTGTVAHRDDMTVAAKTGSAEGARIWQTLIDQNGKKVREPLTPANATTPNTGTEWYRSTDNEGLHVVHAWFMGFAPAEDPEVAFCVLVEYAGAGGGAASGPIVDQILEACVQHGYLHPKPHESPFAVAR